MLPTRPPEQCPAPAGGNGEAQTGGKAEEAEPEADAAGGAVEEEARVGGLGAPDEVLEQVLQVWEQDVSRQTSEKMQNYECQTQRLMATPINPFCHKMPRG